MRFEIVLFVITGIIIANIYTEGRILKLLMSWKKYYQMAGVGFGALVVYFFMKKNPDKTRDILSTTNDYIKYLPLDQNTTNFISPILDFTTKMSHHGEIAGSVNRPVLHLEQRIKNSGGKGTKRSVSETKKKFIASRQNWKCGDCGNQLNAWFEVDHIIRLENQGSNHVDNLIALCRECHGKKTTIENL
jgi:5-methylcytosine-specific restriction endonuclease McrA